MRKIRDLFKPNKRKFLADLIDLNNYIGCVVSGAQIKDYIKLGGYVTIRNLDATKSASNAFSYIIERHEIDLIAIQLEEDK